MSTYIRLPQKLIALIIVICSATLVAIWPLPGTIALRHIILVIGSLASLFFLNRYKSYLLAIYAWPIWLLLGFYVWLLFHLAFLSHQPELQLAELLSIWIRCLLATTIGVGLGLIIYKTSTLHEPDAVWLFSKVLAIIIIGFSGVLIFTLIGSLSQIIFTDKPLYINHLLPPYKAKVPFVITNVLLTPLCFILLLEALRNKINRWWVLACLTLIAGCLFISFFVNTKNGMVVLLISFLIFTVNLIFAFFKSARWRKIFWVPLMGAIFAGYLGIYTHISTNTAYPPLLLDAKIGADIDHQNHWKNRNTYPIPINPLGNAVDSSTYERAAWFTAGTRLLTENPLGFGLIHHSFGWLALEKWSDFYKPVGNLRGATHSGWLDFALGLGIPGLMLVLIPLWSSWYRSLFQKGIWFSYTSWTIPLLTAAYLTTETAGGHFTELLFFMTAFFCGLTLSTEKSQSNRTVT
ncbi:O-antigen ligase family protein [Polynucleobacter sp. MG-6-Vaara-E2]|uniref:O-antigen ligase family protein n=1 Tax=Polynucleobacter sp. MG-6-Vaara-E2 TaxID=2576932 RepID=UPI001BFE1FC5|nr:O-antigen ligase family protein [Polynucleobacter sp. MG-6-Vaara-E2]QWD96898.1 hypothetical protein ICV38_01645 [Polynucleobacter sp. MG-6-Vaara-E2]